MSSPPPRRRPAAVVEVVGVQPDAKNAFGRVKRGELQMVELRIDGKGLLAILSTKDSVDVDDLSSAIGSRNPRYVLYRLNERQIFLIYVTHNPREIVHLTKTYDGGLNAASGEIRRAGDFRIYKTVKVGHVDSLTRAFFKSRGGQVPEEDQAPADPLADLHALASADSGKSFDVESWYEGIQMRIGSERQRAFIHTLFLLEKYGPEAHAKHVLDTRHAEPEGKRMAYHACEYELKLSSSSSTVSDEQSGEIESESEIDPELEARKSVVLMHTHYFISSRPAPNRDEPFMSFVTFEEYLRLEIRKFHLVWAFAKRKHAREFGKNLGGESFETWVRRLYRWMWEKMGFAISPHNKPSESVGDEVLMKFVQGGIRLYSMILEGLKMYGAGYVSQSRFAELRQVDPIVAFLRCVNAGTDGQQRRRWPIEERVKQMVADVAE